MLDAVTRPQRLLAEKAKYDKSHRFNNIYYFIRRQDWIEKALNQVLDNKGSVTAGIDGETIESLRKPEEKLALVKQIQAELKSKRYLPTPVRRAYIPKPNGKMRPLGIPTIKDRVVQCLLKMLLEPIYESDFLDCSSGFRPERRTMDCIATCYANVTKLHKHYWVIEGDIEGCFDRVHHKKLIQIIRRRIADEHIIELIDRFLNAGVMEGTLFKHTQEGIPQGGIFSPLLANIYLHELDRWWYDNYHLTEYQRHKRRKMGLGNYILVRYADDFIILCNGNRKSAEEMKSQLQTFLMMKLSLTLSEEKTLITHVQDGFTFLGFHLLHFRRTKDDAVLLVTPTKKNVQRLRDKIRQMTSHNTCADSEYNKIHALNALLRGWSAYYKHVSSSRIFNSLDYWIAGRLIRWLARKHKLGIYNTARRYSLRQGNRKNIGIRLEHDEILWLFRMGGQRITKYRQPKRDNPYLSTEVLPIPKSDIPDVGKQWNGNSAKSEWLDLRLQRLRMDGYLCTRCQSGHNLDVHHITPKAIRPDLELSIDNLATLCEECHYTIHSNDSL